MWRHYKKKPLGDEQIAAEETIQELLAHDGEEDIGIEQAAQIAYVAHVRAAMGGDNTFEVKMASYFVGLRPDAPATKVIGRGDLAVEGGLLVGRPGFLFSSLAEIDNSGPPGRAYRHKSAWHNLRATLNSISRRHGPGEIRRLYGDVSRRVRRDVREEVDDILKRSGAAASDRPMLWLGLVVNSAPGNLWLGPAKENISINSAASALKRWIAQLRVGTIDLPTFRDKVAAGSFNSRKAREVQAQISAIIRDSAGKKHRTRYVIEMVEKTALSRLEIDLPPAEEERGVSAHHLQIFNTGLTEDLGDVGHRQTIESLLGLEPERRRPSRRAQDDEQLERRGRSRSRRGSVDLESAKRERSRSYSRERPPVPAAAAPLKQRPPRELSRSGSGDSILMPPPPPRPRASLASQRERSRSRSGREAPPSPSASPPLRMRLRRGSSSASPPRKLSGSFEW
jgi:hypothetical protein